MRKEPSPESNVSDLVDYLLSHGVNIHIFVPDDLMPFIKIKGDCIDRQGKQLICSKCISMNLYKSESPEMRNVIVAQALYSLIEELFQFK